MKSYIVDIGGRCTNIFDREPGDPAFIPGVPRLFQVSGCDYGIPVKVTFAASQDV